MDQDKLKKLIFGDTPSALLINVALMIITAVVLALMFFYVYLPSSTKHGQTVTVPDVDSLSLDDATRRLESAGLRYQVFDSSAVNYNPDLPYLTVLSQTPLSGDKVKDNRKIYLTINPSQPVSFELPDDLINSSLKNVVLRLKNNGVRIGSVRRKPDKYTNNVLELIYKGKSISEKQLKQGFKVFKGDEISLVVGDGMGNSTIAIPNLLGMTEGDAEFTLYGLGLGVGQVKYIQYDTIPGVVVRQSPEPYVDEESGNRRKIRLGRTINLWVSEFSGNKK